jgi:tetratricopeptide (TPR) repeat protein
VRGDLAGAAREIRQAREADPLSPSIGVDSGLMLYYAGRYDDAVGEYRKVLELDPAFAQARLALPLALLEKGGAVGARGECPAPAPDPEVADGCLALVAARSGDAQEARGRLSRVAHSERWWIQATVSTALGDKDAALAALDKAYELRSAQLLLLGADPVFDGLRADPRFSELMHRVGVRPIERVSPAGAQGP